MASRRKPEPEYKTLEIDSAKMCDLEKVHAEGVAAFQAGKTISDNPYPVGSTDRFLWADGFNHPSINIL